MDPTAAQSVRLKHWRDTFGRDIVKPHAPDPATGIMRVSLNSLAGTHEWFIDRNGNLVNRTLSGRLFDLPPQAHKPRNALDN